MQIHMPRISKHACISAYSTKAHAHTHHPSCSTPPHAWQVAYLAAAVESVIGVHPKRKNCTARQYFHRYWEPYKMINTSRNSGAPGPSYYWEPLKLHLVTDNGAWAAPDFWVQVSANDTRLRV